MRFTINLATRAYIDHRRVNQVIVVVMVLLLALLAWNVSRLSWNLGELRRLRADITAFEARLNSRPAGVSESDYNRLLTSIRFHNAIIERKTFNWLGLLEQVENATPEGIALSSLVPEAKNGEIKIEGRAKSFAQVRAYLEKLEDAKAFTNILLLSHRDVAFSEKGRGVEFAISCRAVIR